MARIYFEEPDCLPLREVLSLLHVACQTFPVAVLTEDVDVPGTLLGLVELNDGRVPGQLHVHNLILDLLHEAFWVGLRGHFF